MASRDAPANITKAVVRSAALVLAVWRALDMGSLDLTVGAAAGAVDRTPWI